jgi:hypothetical protein
MMHILYRIRLVLSKSLYNVCLVTTHGAQEKPIIGSLRIRLLQSVSTRPQVPSRFKACHHALFEGHTHSATTVYYIMLHCVALYGDYFCCPLGRNVTASDWQRRQRVKPRVLHSLQPSPSPSFKGGGIQYSFWTDVRYVYCAVQRGHRCTNL